LWLSLGGTEVGCREKSVVSQYFVNGREALDIERGVRAKVIEILNPFFNCYEEVSLVAQSGKEVRADVLAVSFKNCLNPLVFAVEVKTHANDEPGKFKDSVFQASRYVQASVAPTANTDLHGLKIDAALVFPSPDYKWYGNRSENDGREFILTGIAFLAERWNVGRLVQQKNDWEIVFGTNDAWSKKKGWMGQAKSRFSDKGILTNRDIERDDFGMLNRQDF
jgi:hypothetical protein